MKVQTAVALWILMSGAAMAQTPQTGMWMGGGPLGGSRSSTERAVLRRTRHHYRADSRRWGRFSPRDAGQGGAQFSRIDVLRDATGVPDSGDQQRNAHYHH